MNIFALDQDPIIAAQYQCDKHVVKMILETAQMLCAAYESGEAPYKRSHYNHPCTVWARSSDDNYRWLIAHGLGLAQEYAYRFEPSRAHKSLEVIRWCGKNMDKLYLPQIGLTDFAQAMPDEYKDPNPIVAYRKYYIGDKISMAYWNKKRSAPGWWTENVKII